MLCSALAAVLSCACSEEPPNEEPPNEPPAMETEPPPATAPPTRLERAAAATDTSPESREGWSELASAQLEAEDWSAAATSAQRALELSGDSPHAEDASTHGQALYQAERYEEARAAFARALQVNPDRTADRLRLGRCEEHLERDEAAEAAYRRAFEGDADDVEARMRLGGLLARVAESEAQWAEAHSLLSTTLDLLPADDEGRRSAIRAHLSEIEEAQQAQRSRELLAALSGPDGVFGDVLRSGGISQEVWDDAVFDDARVVGPVTAARRPTGVGTATGLGALHPSGGLRPGVRTTLEVSAVTGPRSSDEIRRVVRRYMSQFRACQERLPGQPLGQVSLELRIGPDGAVDTTFSETRPSLEACVHRHVRRMRFAAADEETRARVTVDFASPPATP